LEESPPSSSWSSSARTKRQSASTNRRRSKPSRTVSSWRKRGRRNAKSISATHKSRRRLLKGTHVSRKGCLRTSVKTTSNPYAYSRKLLEDYLDKRRSGNKSDDDVLKETFLKIGCCIMVVLIIFAVAFAILLVSSDGKEINISQSVLGLLSKVYPKLAETGPATSDL
jgi:hypothetical protein